MLTRIKRVVNWQFLISWWVIGALLFIIMAIASMKAVDLIITEGEWNKYYHSPAIPFGCVIIPLGNGICHQIHNIQRIPDEPPRLLVQMRQINRNAFTKLSGIGFWLVLMGLLATKSYHEALTELKMKELYRGFVA